MGETEPNARGDGVLSWLLTATREAGPEQLDALLARAGRELGAEDIGVYLVDYEQRQLWPLRTGRYGGDEQDVEASLAGRTYRTLEVLETATDGGVRVWLPLQDGSDRLGVLAADFAASPDVATVERLWDVALLGSGLLVSKGAYTDAYDALRRRERVTLPSEVQQDLLPPLTAITDDVAVAGTLEPSYRVAGDAFDYAINADRLQWIVLDAMGHGLEAALLATVAIGAHRHARRRGADLPQILGEMDAVVAGQFGGDRFLTGLLGELDRGTGRLRVLLAGHHPPLLARDGAVIGELGGEPTLPIGLNRDRRPPAAVEAGLQPGDQVLCYTDGVIEGRSPDDGQLFGLDRLTNLLERELAAQQPAPEAMRRLMRRVLEHQHHQLADDAMLLLLAWFGQRGR